MLIAILVTVSLAVLLGPALIFPAPPEFDAFTIAPNDPRSTL